VLLHFFVGIAMLYSLNREELLNFAKMVFDASVDNYVDLREQTCEHILDSFLADKKTSVSNTHFSYNPGAISVFPTVDFSNPANVFTVSDGMITSGLVTNINSAS